MFDVFPTLLSSTNFLLFGKYYFLQYNHRIKYHGEINRIHNACKYTISDLLVVTVQALYIHKLFSTSYFIMTYTNNAVHSIYISSNYCTIIKQTDNRHD